MSGESFRRDVIAWNLDLKVEDIFFERDSHSERDSISKKELKYKSILVHTCISCLEII